MLQLALRMLEPNIPIETNVEQNKENSFILMRMKNDTCIKSSSAVNLSKTQTQLLHMLISQPTAI